MDAASYLHLGLVTVSGTAVTLYWPSVAGDRTYTVESCTNLVEGVWRAAHYAGPDAPTNMVELSGFPAGQCFFRVTVTNQPFAQH